jgi:hypothetical protein
LFVLGVASAAFASFAPSTARRFAGDKLASIVSRKLGIHKRKGKNERVEKKEGASRKKGNPKEEAMNEEYGEMEKESRAQRLCISDGGVVVGCVV